MLENGRFCADSGFKFDFLGLLGRTHSPKGAFGWCLQNVSTSGPDHFRHLTKKVCLRGSTKTSVEGLGELIEGLIGLDSSLSKALIVPPVDEGRHGGEACGDELLQLLTVDGQDGLAEGRQHLIGQGQQQDSSASDSTSRNFVSHSVLSFLNPYIGVTDRQGLAAVIQFRSSPVATQRVITTVEVFDVFQAGGINIPLLQIEVAGLINAVMQDGEQALFHGFVLHHHRNERSSQQAEGPLCPVFEDELPHWNHPPSKEFVCPRKGSPALGAADTISNKAVLALGIHQGRGSARAEAPVSLHLQQLLQHDGRAAVCGSRASLLDGRQDEGIVGGAGVHTGRGAEPCGLAAARVGVDDGCLAVPVDTNAAEPCFLGQNAKSYRVDRTVVGSPVGRDAIQVAALLAAADLWVSIVLHAAVPRGDLDLFAKLVTKGLHLLHKLPVDHLRRASTRALELIERKILRQRGLVAALATPSN